MSRRLLSLEATVAALTAERREPTLSTEDAEALSALVDYAATRGYEDRTFSAAIAARACDVRNRLLLAARAAPRGAAAPDIIHAYGEDDASQPGWAP